MQRIFICALLGGVTITSACTLPTTPLSNTITAQFKIQVQNASYPEVHNFFLNTLEAGGGDKHLFVGPVGTLATDLTLNAGSLEKGVVHAVIGGEFSTIDSTTKMFTTERGDPKAIFAPTYACNPDTDAVQVELAFVTWQDHPAGGWICVRPTFDNAHEFRYYPPGNTLSDPNRFCIKVTLVMIPTGGVTPTTLSTVTTPPPSSSSSIPVQSSTPSTTVVTATTATTPTSSPTGSTGPLPYTDMTAKGFAFLGCAPEEKTATDGPGRTLSAILLGDDLMTDEKCMDFCTGKGYKYAGTEYRRECWCGNSVAPGRVPKTTLASLAGCSATCMGNVAEKCGGTDWLSLYQACGVGGPCVNAVFT